MLLDQYDALTAQIDRLTARIEELLAAIPAAQGVDADGTTGPGAGSGPHAAVLPAVARLDEAPGRGNPYLRGVLGEAAAAAAKTDTFLGERYRRLVKRRGKLKALVAVARSILVIVWHLLADPTARYHDLGAGYHASRIDKAKKTRNHVRQLEALGFTVTLTSAPAA